MLSDGATQRETRWQTRYFSELNPLSRGYRLDQGEQLRATGSG